MLKEIIEQLYFLHLSYFLTKSVDVFFYRKCIYEWESKCVESVFNFSGLNPPRPG